jgi:leucyl-tRNA synthetase
VCWRCGNPVEKKDLAQWFLRITHYAEELLAGMEEIEAGWAERVLTMQKNWIGRSEGAFVEFQVSGSGSQVKAEDRRPKTEDHIKVFTTRIDTIYGANAIVVAAEHPIIEAHLGELPQVVLDKIKAIKREKAKPTDYGEEVEKDGIDTGLKAVNPFSGEELPVWIGNYVMMEYGTGAVMSVPAHDERDFEFAQKFDLPIRQVIKESAEVFQSSMFPDTSLETDKSQIPNPKSQIESAFTDYGVLVNSGEWSGKTSEDAKREMANYAEEKGFGESAVTYRLRDWGISNRRWRASPNSLIRFVRTAANQPGAKPTRWTRSLIRAGIIFATPTRITRRCLSTRKSSVTGCRLTNTSAALTTP